MSQTVSADVGHQPDASLPRAVYSMPASARGLGGVRTASPPLSARATVTPMTSAWSFTPAVRTGLGGSLSLAVGGSVSVLPADSHGQHGGSFTATLSPPSQTRSVPSLANGSSTPSLTRSTGASVSAHASSSSVPRPVRNVVATPSLATVSNIANVAPAVTSSTVTVGSTNIASGSRYPVPSLSTQLAETQSPTVVYRVLPSGGVYTKVSPMSAPTMPSPLLAASPMRASPLTTRTTSPVRNPTATGSIAMPRRMNASQSSFTPRVVPPSAEIVVAGKEEPATTPMPLSRALSNAFAEREGYNFSRDTYPGEVGGGTGEAATPSATRNATEEGRTGSRNSTGVDLGDPPYLALAIPKLSSAALNAAGDFNSEDPASSAPTEKLEPLVQSTAETAFEKHIQRTQKARDQRHKDIHCVRISATRWEHWDDPWLDSSSSVRCRRTVIPSAGKGERSALPQSTSTPRLDPVRKDSSTRDHSGSPRASATPRAASPSKLSPRSTMGSPRARHGSRQCALSPRSDGKTTKNKRLPGDVLSRCARSRGVPKLGQCGIGAPFEEPAAVQPAAAQERSPVAAQERSCVRSAAQGVRAHDAGTGAIATWKEECPEVDLEINGTAY